MNAHHPAGSRRGPAPVPARDIHADDVLRFYTAVADELRGPINALAGWVEILAAGDREANREALTSARQALHRLRRLADDAHDSAAVVLGELTVQRRPVDLAALVQGVVASVPGARTGDVEAVTVAGDSARLAQILDTLLRAVATGDAVAVTLRRRGPWAELTLAHDKVVPFEALEGLFGSFSRPPGPDDDAVGLFVCRALVVAHGGDIGVGSEKGLTAVWVDLPLAGGDAEPEG